MGFFEKIVGEIEENGMIVPGDHVIVGVSGGADSVCLLCVLDRLRSRNDSEEWTFELSALHVNHKIRGGEADRDEDFVRELCRRLGIELEVVRADVPKIAKERHLSLEEAGRCVRHEAFTARAAKAVADGRTVKVALAHHMDDRAETVLHNIVRGSALKGIAGILLVNEMNGYTIIRPLLGVRKKEIEDWLSGYGQDFCTDSTNSDETYTRNLIRNAVVPLLEKNVNHNAVQNIVQAADFIFEAEEYVRMQAEGALSECRVENELYDMAGGGFSGICIDIGRLNENNALIRKYIIYKALTEIAGQAKDICSVHVSAVMEIADKTGGSSSVDLPYSVSVRREYGMLCMEKGELKIPGNMWYGALGWYKAEPVFAAETAYEKKSLELTENDYTKCIDCDKIKNTLQLRTRQNGDYISIFADGRTKRLKEYLIEQKVPSRYRDRVLLVADGSEIVWIVGFRLSERYKADASAVSRAFISVGRL